MAVRRCQPYDHASAVPLALVCSAVVHFRKALPISGLQDLHATLDQYDAERNHVVSSTRPAAVHGTSTASIHRSHRPDEDNRSTRDPEQSHRPRPIRNPFIRSVRTGRTTTGDSRVGSGTGLEDPDPLTRSEMTGSRRAGTADRNSWLLTLGCQEPAYSMCYMELARGRCAPPSNPRLPAALPGSRPSGGRRLCSFPEMHR